MNDTLGISYDNADNGDKACLLVYKKTNRGIFILKEFFGEEAVKLYKKLHDKESGV
jgi:hypothetical protein